MRNNPCKKDCKDRSVECHGECRKYSDWKNEHDKKRERQRLEEKINRWN